MPAARGWREARPKAAPGQAAPFLCQADDPNDNLTPTLAPQNYLLAEEEARCRICGRAERLRGKLDDEVDEQQRDQVDRLQANDFDDLCPGPADSSHLLFRPCACRLVIFFALFRF